MSSGSVLCRNTFYINYDLNMQYFTLPHHSHQTLIGLLGVHWESKWTTQTPLGLHSDSTQIPLELPVQSEWTSLGLHWDSQFNLSVLHSDSGLSIQTRV